MALVGPVAQGLEQSAHNRSVGGSIPSGPTIFVGDAGAYWLGWLIGDVGHLRQALVRLFAFSSLRLADVSERVAKLPLRPNV